MIPFERFLEGEASDISATMAVATVLVTDLEAAVLDLEAKGVAFLDYMEGPLVTTRHIAQIGPARAAWSCDPDGNILGLRQS
jgi:hypothetical protein